MTSAGGGRTPSRAVVSAVLAGLALTGCGGGSGTGTQADRVTATPAGDATAAAPAGGALAAPAAPALAASPSAAAGSGIVPPTLRTYGAKLSERRLPVTRVPLRLRVPAIGVDQAVTPVGVALDGQLDVPADAASVSWYRFGSGPTEPGSTVLAGHVDFGGREGVFWRLDEVEVGQRLEVATSTGVETFTVTATRRYAKTALPLDALFTRDGPSQLVLITCGGSFDRAARSYRDNVVVIAEPTPRR